jgi:hypothetical protein
MTIFECLDCRKIFDNKFNYERHINRKNKCTNETEYKKKKLRKEIKKNKEEELREKIENDLKQKITVELEEKIKNDIENIKLQFAKEIESLKKDNCKENNCHNTTNNDNSINTTNNDNSINMTNNINFLQNINNNYPNAKNFEDCFKKENITDDMKKICDGKYYYDGAVYLITELSTKDELTRPIHCVDASRRNFIVKRKDVWEKDIGGEKMKQEIIPLVDNVYYDVYKKRFEKNGDIKERLENIQFLEAKAKNKRFKKIIDRTASYFVINKKQKDTKVLVK